MSNAGVAPFPGFPVNNLEYNDRQESRVFVAPGRAGGPPHTSHAGQCRNSLNSGSCRNSYMLVLLLVYTWSVLSGTTVPVRASRGGARAV